MTFWTTQALPRLRTSLTHARQNTIAVVRGDLTRLDSYVVFLMPLVFASFYVLPKTEQRYLIYVGCLLPMVLYVRPVVIRAVRREPVWWLTVSLCGLWILSIAWSQNLTHESVFNTLRIGFAVALFMHACLWLAVQGKLPRERIITAILLTAGVMGVLTIGLALLSDLEMTSRAGRLIGFGWARHSGIGGDIYAFAGLIALVGLTEGRGRSARSGLILVLMLAMCSFYVVLTESRGAVLALGTSAVLLVLVTRPKHLLTLIAVVAAVWLITDTAELVDFGRWLERGSSHRVEMWQHALTLFLENPALGLGAADVTRLDAGRLSFNSTHNIFAAMALDLGAVGLAMFLALTGLLVWRAVALVRAGRGALSFALVAFGYAVMMVHTQTVIIMPAREWLIFWLPLMLLVQESAAHRRGAGAPATPA